MTLTERDVKGMAVGDLAARSGRGASGTTGVAFTARSHALSRSVSVTVSVPSDATSDASADHRLTARAFPPRALRSALPQSEGADLFHKFAAGTELRRPPATPLIEKGTETSVVVPSASEGTPAATTNNNGPGRTHLDGGRAAGATGGDRRW